MLQDILNQPVFGPLLLVLVPALVGYGMSLIGKRKQQAESAIAAMDRADELAAVERRQQIDLGAIKQQMSLDKLRHQDALDKISMEGELNEARRAQVVLVEAERLRLETAQSQQVLVETLGEQNKALANIASVQDKVHDLANGSKAAVDAMVVDLRTQIKTVETAATTASLTAAVALQTFKDLAAAEMRAKDLQIATLTQQLAGLVPPAAAKLPGQADPLPVSTGPPLPAETPTL